MLSRVQVLAYQFNDPRKIALLINLLLIALVLSGCGNGIPACPAGSSGSCGGTG